MSKLKPILFSAPMVKAILDGRKCQTRRVVKPSLLHPESPIQYKATSDFGANEDGIWGRTRPAIFIPKFASRITLNVLSVGVCHLNPISSEDAIKEGIEQVGFSDGVPTWKDYENDNAQCAQPKMSFETLWKSINGEGSWDENPWVYVVEFEHAEVQS